MSCDLFTYRNHCGVFQDLLPYFPHLEAVTVSVEGGMMAEVARTTQVYDGRAVPAALQCGNKDCLNGLWPLASLVCSLLQEVSPCEHAHQHMRVMCEGSLLPSQRRSRPCAYGYWITVITACHSAP